MREIRYRRFLVALGVVALALGLVLGLRSGRKLAVSPAAWKPQVLKVGSREITLVWRTDTPQVGRVYYRRAGRDEPPQLAMEAQGPAFQHEVTLKDLEVGARYQYWLEGTETRYQVQTQPDGSTPFSFLVVGTDEAADVLRWWMSEMPDFVLSLRRPSPEADLFEAVRPFAPVFEPDGRNLLAGGPPAEDAETRTRSLDWGGLRLVFAGSDFDADNLLLPSGAHTLGVVAGAVTGLVDGRLKPDALRASTLHRAIVAHGREPRVTFVLVAGGHSEDMEVDGIHYISLPAQVSLAASDALRVDVAPASVTALSLARGRALTLRQAAVKRKLTCEECRRLADRGAYEESVRAYQEFIATHAGHYQIDDAYLAIAEILDENLFRFAEALGWYRKLQTEYPQSSLAPLAQQRMALLTAFSDYDFKPLEQFERLRQRERTRPRRGPEDLESLFAEGESILRDYPGCAVMPDLLYWLANQCRSADPDRAVATYRRLIEGAPTHPHARNAWLEIGETFYGARRYREAIGAYEAAQAAVPERAEVARSQISRCYRNLRRLHLAVFSMAWVLLGAAVAAGWPPMGLAVRTLRWALAAFVPLALAILAAGWFIHEQFPSLQTLAGLAAGWAASASVAFTLGSTLADKWCKPAPGRALWPAATLGSLLSLVFFIAGVYLTVYLVNEHYLILVRL